MEGYLCFLCFFDICIVVRSANHVRLRSMFSTFRKRVEYGSSKERTTRPWPLSPELGGHPPATSAASPQAHSENHRRRRLRPPPRHSECHHGEQKRFRKCGSSTGADAGRYPMAGKIVMRRASRRSIVITSGQAGIRSAAWEIRGLMNKSLTVLSAAKRFLFTITSGESISLGVFGCQGQIPQLFQTHKLLLHSSYIPTCYFVQCTAVSEFLLAMSSSWRPQGQACVYVSLLPCS